MRGRKPVPTETLKQRGSWRADAREGEPELDISAPDAPDWLESAAQEHWTKICALLVSVRVMSDMHASALVLLVNALGRYIEAEREVNTHGAWFTDPLKGPKVHPAWTVRCKAWEHVAKLLVEFGMTPSALSRVKSTPKEPQSKDGNKFKPKLVG